MVTSVPVLVLGSGCRFSVPVRGSVREPRTRTGTQNQNRNPEPRTQNRMLSDLEYMNRALDLAGRGRGTTSPNPMVGAVIVREDGTIVGQGYHERAGGPHAEVRALDEAGDLARGASLFCTLEPCAHVGRTGPCVERVAAAGIARVVAATGDPDPRVSGRGFDFLRRKGIDVSVGTARERALRLNRPYFTFKTKRRPFIVMKAATSLDNRIAAKTGERTRISSDDALRHAHAVRAEIDAIAVGSGTVLADDPLLTAREVHRGRPLARVLFDRRLRIRPSARVFSTLDAGPVIIVTTPESIERNRTPRRRFTAGGRAVGADNQWGSGGGVRPAWRTADDLSRPRRGRRLAGRGMESGSRRRRASLCRADDARGRRRGVARYRHDVDCRLFSIAV